MWESEERMDKCLVVVLVDPGLSTGCGGALGCASVGIVVGLDNEACSKRLLALPDHGLHLGVQRFHAGVCVAILLTPLGKDLLGVVRDQRTARLDGSFVLLGGTAVNNGTAARARRNGAVGTPVYADR